jgi:prolyl-tRNA editing enzyme YbaK/EbsC (Cys-tRNA(Pro) deacylase)
MGGPYDSLHPTAARYQQILREHGVRSQVRMLPHSTRTAAEAAAAIGVATGQIVKSLVFMRDGAPVIVLCAGDRTVDAERLRLSRASAKQVRALTGYAIGGIPPIGHGEIETIIDASLQRFDELWAAAGHPHAVFAITPAELRTALPHASVLEP